MSEGITIQIAADNGNIDIADVRSAIKMLRALEDYIINKEAGSGKTRGVCWDRANKKWRARKSRNGKLVNLGLFDVYRDAEKAVLDFLTNESKVRQKRLSDGVKKVDRSFT